VNAFAGPLDMQTAREAIGVTQSNGADKSSVQQLFDLQDQGMMSVRNLQCFVEAWWFAGEQYVDDGAANGRNLSCRCIWNWRAHRLTSNELWEA
jgi:hypothetical protein